MNEPTIQLISSLKIVWLALFSFLYGWGGISGKWKRRYVAPFLLTTGLVLFSLWAETFKWVYLVYFPLLSIAFHLGYGANTLGIKLRKRAIYGFAVGVAAIPIGLSTSMYALLGLHIFLCVTLSVILGVFNITKNARSEETLIAVGSGLLPLFMI